MFSKKDNTRFFQRVSVIKITAEFSEKNKVDQLLVSERPRDQASIPKMVKIASSNYPLGTVAVMWARYLQVVRKLLLMTIELYH